MKTCHNLNVKELKRTHKKLKNCAISLKLIVWNLYMEILIQRIHDQNTFTAPGSIYGSILFGLIDIHTGHLQQL